MKVLVGFCIELLKSIYRLKLASRLFHQLFVTFLLTLDFVANPSDRCVMYLSAGADFALLAIHDHPRVGH
jgi:hypothetical protein